MSDIRNYGSITANSEQNRRESSEDGQSRRYPEINWKQLLSYYCAIVGLAVLALLCMMAILRIMLDDMPLPGKIAMLLLGTPFIVLCCCFAALYAIGLRKLTTDDSLEEQQPSNLETQVQNPDSPLETERLLTSSPKIGSRNPDSLRQATRNPEVGVRNPDSLRQIEELGISNPEIGIQKPDSLRQTEELDTGNPDIGVQMPGSWP